MDAKRKLVEVFIDTDSESESHTSSEVVVSDDAEEDGTGTANEGVGAVGVEGVGGEDDLNVEMVSPELSAEEGTIFLLITAPL